MVNNYYSKIEHIIKTTLNIDNINLGEGYLQYVLKASIVVIGGIIGLLIVAITMGLPIVIFHFVTGYFEKKVKRKKQEEFKTLEKYDRRSTSNKEVKESIDIAYKSIDRYISKLKVYNIITNISLYITYGILIMPFILTILDITHQISASLGIVLGAAYILAGVFNIMVLGAFIIDEDVDDYMDNRQNYLNREIYGRRCF